MFGRFPLALQSESAPVIPPMEPAVPVVDLKTRQRDGSAQLFLLELEEDSAEAPGTLLETTRAAARSLSLLEVGKGPAQVTQSMQTQIRRMTRMLRLWQAVSSLSIDPAGNAAELRYSVCSIR